MGYRSILMRMKLIRSLMIRSIRSFKIEKVQCRNILHKQ